MLFVVVVVVTTQGKAKKRPGALKSFVSMRIKGATFSIKTIFHPHAAEIPFCPQYSRDNVDKF